jgi:hypothetical protein
MFNSAMLEVAIGVVFVYVLFATFCTVVREVLEGFLKTRAAYLDRGVRELLHDLGGTGLAKELYTHPLIYGLYRGVYPQGGSGNPSALARGGNLPSYIPTNNFALALIDIVAQKPLTSGQGRPPLTVDSLRDAVNKIADPSLQRIMTSALDFAGDDIERVRANLAAWFDSGMDRVSGWYKRSTQGIIFVIALVCAVTVNVDTIAIANYLYQNDTVRHALVAQAGAAKAGELDNKTAAELKNRLDALRLPIGWPVEETPAAAGAGAPTKPAKDTSLAPRQWLMVAAGWLLTALAATLGAPFWFDVLNRLMVIRSTVKPHEKSPEEASEDRQAVNRAAATAPAKTGVDRANAAAGSDARPAGQAGDTESDVDACDATAGPGTPDDKLPAADGGVR